MITKYINYAEIFGFTLPKILNRTTYEGSLPKIYCSTIPKAGTHLLERILTLNSPLKRYFHITLDEIRHSSIPDEQLQQVLSRVSEGEFILSHLYHKAKRENIVRDNDFRIIQLIRDPRDIIVSDCFYIANNKNHPNHKIFAGKSLSERIRLCILGDLEYSVNYVDIGKKLQYYLDWIQCNPFVFRYEDFINSDLNQKADIIAHLYNFLGVALNRESIKGIAEKSISKKSVTFRSGKIGKWKNHFSDENISLFKEIAGDQIIQLGYERNNNW